ncbi:MAG: methyl-accepting chemotaxis protein [Acidobacteria bacterium]|nr:methyl-accepting chemotaxis protein [Acidobacteriota bacterium]
MFDKLNHLKIWRKLALVSALLAVPVFALLYVFVDGQYKRIEHTRLELDGLEYVSTLRAAAAQLPTGAQARGNAEAAIAKVDDADGRLSGKLGVTGRWPSIRKTWTESRQNLDAVALNSQLNDLVEAVGEKSNLRADEKRDVFALADTVLNHGPLVSEALAGLRSVGLKAALQGTLTGEDSGKLWHFVKTLERSNAAVKRDMDTAMEGEAVDANGPAIPNGRLTLRTAAANALLAAEKLREQVANQMLARPEAPILDGAQLSRLVEAASEDYAVLMNSSMDRMRSTLNGRVGDLRDVMYAQLGTGLLVLVFAGTIIFSVNLGITRQVRTILKTFDSIRAGDYEARAEFFYNDELGKVSGSLNSMLENTVTLIQSREERDQIQGSIMKLLDEVSGVAEGDLRKEAEVTSDVTGAIADSFNYMIGELRGLIRSVQDTSVAVSVRANEMESRAESLAEGSVQQSEQIAEASRTIEQINNSIRQVASAANTAADVAESALEHARGGTLSVRLTMQGMDSIRGQVQETAKRVKRLGESSQEIGEIVQLIGDIADRTSILALNASIQAAAAGEAGRGFAVVAEEVERLAERATQSTKRISALIRSVQTDTSEAIVAMEKTTREVVDGSQLANDAGGKLERIESVSQEISGLVREILEATQLQAESSEAVTRKVAGVSEFTMDTAANAREVENSMTQLAALSRQLSDSMGRFKLPAGSAAENREFTAV